MEQKDYLKIKRNIETAEEDTKPVVGVIGNDVVVNGDVNNIKIEPKDYTLHFIMPTYMTEGTEAIDQGNGYSVLDIEYRDIFPTVQDNMKYTSALVQLLPFFKKLKEDGTIENLSDEEALISIFDNMKDEVVDALYRLVTVVLGVDDALKKWISPFSLIATGAQIIEDFPNIINQADLFFA